MRVGKKHFDLGAKVLEKLVNGCFDSGGTHWRRLRASAEVWLGGLSRGAKDVI
jgi:hypothetical protein